MHEFNYETCCLEAKALDLAPMIDNCIDITYRTFMENINTKQLRQIIPHYATDKRNGLTIKDDWAVSYHRSHYRGKLCSFICWSSIEYIFTKGGNNEYIL